MQFRLSFDTKVCDALLKKISVRANGGSPNKALKTMIIEWSAIEDARNMSKTGRETGIIQENNPDVEDELSAALDDIEAAFDE